MGWTRSGLFKKRTLLSLLGLGNVREVRLLVEIQWEIIHVPKCNLHLQKPLLSHISESPLAGLSTHTQPICFSSAELAELHPYLLYQHPRPFIADKREIFTQGGCGNTAFLLARSPMPCFWSQINNSMDSLSVSCRQWLKTHNYLDQAGQPLGC